MRVFIKFKLMLLITACVSEMNGNVLTCLSDGELSIGPRFNLKKRSVQDESSGIRPDQAFLWFFKTFPSISGLYYAGVQLLIQ